MKKMFKGLFLCMLLSLLLISVAAANTPDDSLFLEIDQTFDHTPVMKKVHIGDLKDTGNEASRNYALDGEEDMIIINETMRKYHSIDLKDYTTEELVAFILNDSRSMTSMLYFSSTDDPYEEAKPYYHGLAELEKRDDALQTLIDALYTLKAAKANTETEKIIFDMRIEFLEKVLNAPFYSKIAESILPSA